MRADAEEKTGRTSLSGAGRFQQGKRPRVRHRPIRRTGFPHGRGDLPVAEAIGLFFRLERDRLPRRKRGGTALRQPGPVEMRVNDVDREISRFFGTVGEAEGQRRFAALAEHMDRRAGFDLKLQRFGRGQDGAERGALQQHFPVCGG